MKIGEGASRFFSHDALAANGTTFFTSGPQTTSSRTTCAIGSTATCSGRLRLRSSRQRKAASGRPRLFRGSYFRGSYFRGSYQGRFFILNSQQTEQERHVARRPDGARVLVIGLLEFKAALGCPEQLRDRLVGRRRARLRAGYLAGIEIYLACCGRRRDDERAR